MTRLAEITNYCDQRLEIPQFPDFPGANNGLQIQNKGEVHRIGAAVDAGLVPFQLAAERGVDFLLVHHGLFWNPPASITGPWYHKLQIAFKHNLALYSAHLPLDAHPEIGNNALLAADVGIQNPVFFLPYEDRNMAIVGDWTESRAALRQTLENRFPNGVTAIEYGSDDPQQVAVLTGSGRSAIPRLASVGSDTLITGELRQEHFNVAQELRLNLYVCGHYATEMYGVRALARELSEEFGLPWTFIETPCPL